MTVLRAARSTDAGAVGGILTEFAATTPWMPRLHTGAEDIAHAGALIHRGWVTVAVEKDAVIAFSACDGVDLDALYVMAHARGNGVGSTLLDRLKRQTPVLELWTFQANHAAHRFYERHGFFEVTKTNGARNDEKLPDIKYRWQKEADG